MSLWGKAIALLAAILFVLVLIATTPQGAYVREWILR